YYECFEREVGIDTVTTKDLPHVVPDMSLPPVHGNQYSNLWTDDIKEDILFCKDVVEKKGMEMLVLDPTRSDIGMPVVKVIVPELRHFWPRFAPGRLYDVPVKLGWLSAPLAEEQLNPIMIFS